LRDAAQNIALAGVEREKKRKAAEEKYQELKKKQTELTQYIQQKTTEYKNLVTQRHRELLEEIYNEIRQYAVLKGYDFVFDKSGSVTMLYTNSKYDRSDEVLDYLGIVPGTGNDK